MWVQHNGGLQIGKGCPFIWSVRKVNPFGGFIWHTESILLAYGHGSSYENSLLPMA